jgi:antitoxin component YwqK of YwqJK toxin-antitoxin module
MKKCFVFLFLYCNCFGVKLSNEYISLKDFRAFTKQKKYLPSLGENFTGLDTIIFTNIDSSICKKKAECGIYVIRKYENGTLLTQNSYFLNWKPFNFSFFDKNGELTETIEFRFDGTIDFIIKNGFDKNNIDIFFNEKGKIASIENELDNFYLSKGFYENGFKKDELRKVKSNKLVEDYSIYKSWYENGNLKDSTILSQTKTNYWAFYENGNKFLKGINIGAPGLFVDSLISWNENGTIRFVERYDSIMPMIKHGVSLYYSENGNLIRREEYYKGQLMEITKFSK